MAGVIGRGLIDLLGQTIRFGLLQRPDQKTIEGNRIENSRRIKHLAICDEGKCCPNMALAELLNPLGAVAIQVDVQDNLAFGRTYICTREVSTCQKRRRVKVQ